ncbi:MAG: hypothetical protein ABI969_14575, partial [bacterium]
VETAGSRLRKFMQPSFANTQARVERAEAVRQFTLPKDSSITPTQAGIAFNNLQPSGASTTRFVFKDVASRPPSPWPDEKLAPELFPISRFVARRKTQSVRHSPSVLRRSRPRFFATLASRRAPATSSNS